MRYYVEAYDKNDRQILGNLDGQAALNVKNYRRTKRYRHLPYLQTLNGRVKYYRIVDEQGRELETVMSDTHRS